MASEDASAGRLPSAGRACGRRQQECRQQKQEKNVFSHRLRRLSSWFLLPHSGRGGILFFFSVYPNAAHLSSVGGIQTSSRSAPAAPSPVHTARCRSPCAVCLRSGIWSRGRRRWPASPAVGQCLLAHFPLQAQRTHAASHQIHSRTVNDLRHKTILSFFVLT